MTNDVIMFIGKYHACHRAAYQMREKRGPFRFTHITNPEQVLGHMRSTLICAIGQLDPYHEKIIMRLHQLGYTVHYGNPDEKEESTRCDT